MSNKIYKFATSSTANVMSDADYASDTELSTGNRPGIARSAFVNKTLKQTAFISSCIGSIAASVSSSDITDDTADNHLKVALRLGLQKDMETAPLIYYCSSIINDDTAKRTIVVIDSSQTAQRCGYVSLAESVPASFYIWNDSGDTNKYSKVTVRDSASYDSQMHNDYSLYVSTRPYGEEGDQDSSLHVPIGAIPTCDRLMHIMMMEGEMTFANCPSQNDAGSRVFINGSIARTYADAISGSDLYCALDGLCADVKELLAAGFAVTVEIDWSSIQWSASTLSAYSSIHITDKMSDEDSTNLDYQLYCADGSTPLSPFAILWKRKARYDAFLSGSTVRFRVHPETVRLSVSNPIVGSVTPSVMLKDDTLFGAAMHGYSIDLSVVWSDKQTRRRITPNMIITASSSTVAYKYICSISGSSGVFMPAGYSLEYNIFENVHPSVTSGSEVSGSCRYTGVVWDTADHTITNEYDRSTSLTVARNESERTWVTSSVAAHKTQQNIITLSDPGTSTDKTQTDIDVYYRHSPSSTAYKLCTLTVAWGASVTTNIHLTAGEQICLQWGVKHPTGTNRVTAMLVTIN